MDIKKALSYIAFGFLFTLVNFNLTLNGHSVNIMPEFVGWILFFLAFDKLGDYISDKTYMKWISLILVIATGAIYILEIMGVEFDISIFKTICGLVSAGYLFILFGCLENVARDYGSNKESTLGILKIINLVLYVGATVLAIVANNPNLEGLVFLVMILLVMALVSAIITAVVLFKLRKEINNTVIDDIEQEG